MVNSEPGSQNNFLEEATNLLNELEILTQAIKYRDSDRAIIDDAIRVTLSLKSSALGVGFEGLSQMAYRFESLLDYARNAQGQGGYSLTNSLLAYHDLLQAYVEGLKLDRNFKLSESSLPSITFPDSTVLEPKPINLNSSDSNLYFRAFIRGSKSQFPDDDAILYRDISQLGIPSTFQTDNFAATALSVLRSHPIFSSVARVALIRRVGLANQLEVVSSASEGKQNSMTKGYRCFVAPTGSLFKLSQHSMRVFGSAKKIVGDYERRGLPAQRSIKRVSKMGLESGIATGIFSGSNMIGLLFLNATDEALAKLPPDALPLIGNLSILAHRRFLDINRDSLYMGTWSSNYTDLVGELYSFQKLVDSSALVAGLLQTPPVGIEAAGPDSLSTIVVHAHIAYLVLRLATCVRCSSVKISASVSADSLVFSLSLKGNQAFIHDQPALKLMIADARILGYELKLLSKGEALLVTNYDPYAGTFADAPYSIEHQV